MERRFSQYVVPRSIKELLDDEDYQEYAPRRRRQRRLQTVRRRT